MPVLSGAVAIVTGASRGVGKGCAVELGNAGATVYVTGRTLEPGSGPLPGTITATAEAVTEAGGRGIPVRCDHRDDDQVAALFERVEREAGHLDVLVNNAFLIPPELTAGRKFWEVPLSNWDDMIDVGTRSAFVASALAARIMIRAQRGLIANISSSGAAKYAWHVCYGVGKCALDRLTADTAHELAAHGVSVVSLWPGLVLTERIQASLDQLPGLAKIRGESPRFTGRAVVALATDPDVARHSGKDLASRDLARLYGFRDVDGRLPDGPLEERPVP
jgi:NAD(P)-dependent dehydrogenase (short-subunit alcohol dehydrogenase family)